MRHPPVPEAKAIRLTQVRGGQTAAGRRTGQEETDGYPSNAALRPAQRTAQAGLGGRMAVERHTGREETDGCPSHVVQAGIGGGGRSTSC